MGSRLHPRGALVVLLALCLVSCTGGGDDDEASSAEPSPPVAAATTTTPPSFSGEGGELFCDQARTANAQVQRIPQVDTADALRAQLTTAAGSVRSMVDVAPDQIKPDVRVMAGVYDDMVDALSKAGWEPAGFREEAQKLASPEVRAAGDRLQAYERAVCGSAG